MKRSSVATMALAGVLGMASAAEYSLVSDAYAWHRQPATKPKGHKKLREQRKAKRAMRKASRK